MELKLLHEAFVIKIKQQRQSLKPFGHLKYSVYLLVWKGIQPSSVCLGAVKDKVSVGGIFSLSFKWLCEDTLQLELYLNFKN